MTRPGAGRRAHTVTLAVLLTACGPEADPSGTPVAQALRQRPLSDLVVEVTPERVARGRYLVEGPLHCFTCHAERAWSEPGAPPLTRGAGATFREREGVYLAAPNLTPDDRTGTGSWPDDALLRAFREGVGYDGRGLGGMYWWAFASLSDEDAHAVVAYLRSLEPVSHRLAPRRLTPEGVEELSAGPEPLTEPVPAPDLTDPVERGRYLISIADCGGCHSAWESDVMPGFMGGGNDIERGPASAFSANISPDTSGIGGWDVRTFIDVMRSGKGGTLDPTMPWIAFRTMTDDDLEAVYLALRELRPVRHWVNNTAAPTHCVVCGREHGLGELNSAPTLRPTVVDSARAARLIGRYDFLGDPIDIAWSEGLLAVVDSGAPVPVVALTEIAPGRFYGPGLVSPVSFELPAEGSATTLVSHEIPIVRAARIR